MQWPVGLPNAPFDMPDTLCIVSFACADGMDDRKDSTLCYSVLLGYRCAADGAAVMLMSCWARVLLGSIAAMVCASAVALSTSPICTARTLLNCFRDFKHSLQQETEVIHTQTNTPRVHIHNQQEVHSIQGEKCTPE